MITGFINKHGLTQHFLARKEDFFSVYYLYGQEGGGTWEGTFQTNPKTTVSLESYQSQGLVSLPVVLPQGHHQSEHRSFNG